MPQSRVLVEKMEGEVKLESDSLEIKEEPLSRPLTPEASAHSELWNESRAIAVTRARSVPARSVPASPEAARPREGRGAAQGETAVCAPRSRSNRFKQVPQSCPLRNKIMLRHATIKSHKCSASDCVSIANGAISDSSIQHRQSRARSAAPSRRARSAAPSRRARSAAPSAARSRETRGTAHGRAALAALLPCSVLMESVRVEHLLYKCTACHKTILQNSSESHECANSDCVTIANGAYGDKTESYRCVSHGDSLIQQRQTRAHSAAPGAAAARPQEARGSAPGRAALCGLLPCSVTLEKVPVEQLLYECSACRKTFLRGTTHVCARVHCETRAEGAIDKKKTLFCDNCQKKFSSKKTLIEHLKLYENVPFLCDICEKLFTNFCALNNHRRAHFTCTICQVVFENLYYLNKHKLTHSNKIQDPIRISKKQLHIQLALNIRELRRHSVPDIMLVPYARTAPDRRSHECDSCNKSFRTRGTLSAHKSRHHPRPKPFSCDICKKKFAASFALDKHELYHLVEDNDSYLCNTCGKSYVQKPLFIDHLLTHSGLRPYSCDICKREFSSRTRIAEHMLIHTGAKPLSCEVCNKRFRQRSGLSKHRLIHSQPNVRPHACDFCDKAFRRRTDLFTHRLIHIGIKSHVCSVCRKAFTRRSTLAEHMRVHSKEKRHCCKICKKVFSSHSNLTGHMRIHSGGEMLSCEFCNKQFGLRSALNQHRVSHSTTRPYACDVCNKAFRRPQCLSVHKRIHSGIKSNACDVCKKRFLRPYALSQHMKVHSGEKPYTCDFCKKSFALRSNLTEHMLIHMEVKSYSCEFCRKVFRLRSTLVKHKQVHTRYLVVP